MMKLNIARRHGRFSYTARRRKNGDRWHAWDYLSFGALAIASVGALAILMADTGQRHRNVVASREMPSSREERVENPNDVVVAIPRKKPVLPTKANPPGVVRSSKTGARARVGSRYAARFQAYIDDLEHNYGARVLFMGGIRPGPCSTRSEHPCGKALDVCQLSRGVVDRRCHLPGRVTLGRIAAAHGLFEGGRWCNSDYGHAQVDVTAAGCGSHRIRAARQNNAVTSRRAELAPGAIPVW